MPIRLPPDPEPIQYPRPENYLNADNPYSGNNVNANFNNFSQTIGNQIGNMNHLRSAFDGSLNKPHMLCTGVLVSTNTFNNWVGVNWGGDISGITVPTSLAQQPTTNTVASFLIQAPNDKPFLNSGPTTFHIDGSPDSVSWTTLYTGTTQGTIAEQATANITGAPYQFHRVAFQGDGTSIALAQLQFNLANAAQNDI